MKYIQYVQLKMITFVIIVKLDSYMGSTIFNRHSTMNDKLICNNSKIRLLNGFHNI